MRRTSGRLGSVLALACAAWSGVCQPAQAASRMDLVLVAGAAGEETYGAEFARWGTVIENAARGGDVQVTRIGMDPESAGDFAALEAAVRAAHGESDRPLWLVLLGHGTYDGRDARFNLRGADVTAAQLAQWLKPVRRPTAVVCGFSTSGAFLRPLSAPNRVAVTATKSGDEVNYSRFGGMFSEVLASTQADLDHDGQVSLLEAYLAASRRVEDFYRTEGRLATEHALLDDNGDALGTPGSFFKGVRVVKKSADNSAVDGAFANRFHLTPGAAEQQLDPAARARRDQFEGEVLALRDRKAQMAEAEYYDRLAWLAGEMARAANPDHPAARARVIGPGTGGVYELLARDAIMHGTRVRYEPQAHKNTIGYWTGAGDWVEWQLDGVQAGRYQVEVVQAAGPNSGGSEYEVVLGDARIRDVVPETGSFTNFVTRNIGELTVTATGRVAVVVRPLTKPGVAVMDLRRATLRPIRQP